MSEMMNAGANSPEIMFDSMLVDPFHFRVAKGPSAETWQANSFQRIENAGRISIAGMNSLLKSRDKLERKLNDKRSVVCIQYFVILQRATG
jgi:hypothetical protein